MYEFWDIVIHNAHFMHSCCPHKHGLINVFEMIT